MDTEIQLIPLEEIMFNRFQYEGAQDDAKVLEIASSISQHRDNGTRGLLQVPTARRLTARQIEDPSKIEIGPVELAFGHHRYLAFKKLAETDPFFAVMPVMVRELSDIDMFELMAIENFHRRDISPMEEARTFYAYMNTFGKTSVETAAKFEKTEEYVRQSVRLLNLPEPAMRLVEDGTLTKTEARDLLVLNKVGGEELVQKAMEALQDEDFDSPKEAFSYALRQGAQWLDKDAGWFSASKNFPHKHLPALTLGQLEEFVRYADEFGSGIPILVIKDILTHLSAGMEVTEDAFPQINPDDLLRIRVLANPTPCEKCPFHAVLDGSHYCGLKLCKDRKESAWEKKVFEDKVKKIGVPMYRKEDGPHLRLDPHEKADQKLWSEGSPDLRIMSRPRSYMTNFEGLDGELQAVIVGETFLKRKAAIDKKNAKVDDENQREAEERDLRSNITRAKVEAILKFSWDAASRVFASALDGITSLEVLKFMLSEINRSPDFPEDLDIDEVLKDLDSMKKADALKHMRRVLVFGMIERYIYENDLEVPYNDKKPVILHAKKLETIAGLWEVKLTKDFTSEAEKYQTELDAAIKEMTPKKAKK